MRFISLQGQESDWFISLQGQESDCKMYYKEREYLAKRVRLKLIADEKEMLYVKWDIPPESKQRRRLQLASKLWSDPLNTQNVSQSAEVVVKLVGFRESGEHVSAKFCFRSCCDKRHG
ncbi:Kinesin-like protein NACK2 [Capsicum baccatum]|uniref:Kinesin-like protein NACK2 n=1 Tax=Capsicum baccatum TaxID=33114 RepID=A0A2G2VHL0_CAPBA|nr:Kinesin-like protein NACK2 [Capsicum baccatum]